ncbi:porin family protein [Vibrio ostreicida]|uniref:Porin family protein n=1 Tax=Vibrio ostreicida TaxID=526588 RepID=A0ABT8C2S5_9VIBR|nr:porin family protein [Vibrio ostreicida]MDN3611815.1 porin family protein [Vibrio ostreicida]MDN3612652.1 porin family protein [Vibrio ostreicida]MDN3612679.1 porin family protein [Vibrio ostreicida]NPD09629.1 porin family protein [Vibrio ostreicida]
MKKLILATLLFSPLTFAQSYEGFYVGGGLGSTTFSDDGYYNDVDTTLSGYGYETKTSSETDGLSYRLIGGYQFNRIIAVEAQYTKYGSVKANTKLNNTTIGTSESDYSSFTVAANLGYTFDNGIRPFVTAGLGSISVDQTNHSNSTSASNNFSFSDSATALRVGAGMEYSPEMFKGGAVRLAYEVDHFGLDTGGKTYTQSIGSFYLGGTYKF